MAERRISPEELREIAGEVDRAADAYRAAGLFGAQDETREIEARSLSGLFDRLQRVTLDTANRIAELERELDAMLADAVAVKLLCPVEPAATLRDNSLAARVEHFLAWKDRWRDSVESAEAQRTAELAEAGEALRDLRADASDALETALRAYADPKRHADALNNIASILRRALGTLSAPPSGAQGDSGAEPAHAAWCPRGKAWAETPMIAPATACRCGVLAAPPAGPGDGAVRGVASGDEHFGRNAQDARDAGERQKSGTTNPEPEADPHA